MLRTLRVRLSRAAAAALVVGGLAAALPAPASAGDWHRPRSHFGWWAPFPPPPFFLPPPPVIVHRHGPYCGHSYYRPHRSWYDDDRYYDRHERRYDRHERRRHRHHDDD